MQATLNRTIQELKYGSDQHQSTFFSALNRTIQELKLCECGELVCVNMSLNRTIQEFQFLYGAIKSGC